MELSNILSIASITIVTGFGSYEIYKRFLEKPKVKLFTGSKVDLASSFEVKDGTAYSRIKKFHVYCIFVNTSMKAGVIKKMSLRLKNLQNNEEYYFSWDHFFVDKPGGIERQAETLYAYPIYIGAKESVLKGIQFSTKDKRFEQQDGKFCMTISTWLNNDISKEADVRIENIVATITKENIKNLYSKTHRMGKSGFETITIDPKSSSEKNEWN